MPNKDSMPSKKHKVSQAPALAEAKDLPSALHTAAYLGDDKAVKAIAEVIDREETQRLLNEMDNDELG